jgi:hypothetical protein
MDRNNKVREKPASVFLISKTKHRKYLWEDVAVPEIKLVLDEAEATLQENAIVGD